ncbi:DUF1513 domain-containing protein [Crenobacter cavernae]|uniref:DUF1513 domain-containing protein n=1 Tax=Crenobacter cavernae TaxID=2290923 RepID=A0ABY0FEG6_9NEIS|nr:DUF1513 domain-containing protein [Crenobacter cavernae]RXZ42615.1 DUF1513 domain-containing protein [Crenobacter cavernae]
MKPTATDKARRRVLKGALALVASYALPVLAGEAPLTLLAAWNAGRRSFAGRLPKNGNDLVGAPLPTRGHHLAPIPSRPGEMLVFARRPGRTISHVDWVSGRELARYDYPEERHGFGHGVFAPDGALYTTDSDVDTGNGLIARRDPRTLKTLAEWPSGGIGPHELVPLADGRLLVANGGILTLPETGRLKLNRGSMAPSLVVFDPRTGKIDASFTLPDNRLSIRHLAKAADGSVGVALQYEGDTPNPPVMARFHPRDGLRLLDAPIDTQAPARGYAASVAGNGRRFAATCPKGDAVLVWEADGAYAGSVAIPQASGIAATPDGRRFVVSSETGLIAQFDADTLALRPELERRFPVRWDNHLSLVAG